MRKTLFFTSVMIGLNLLAVAQDTVASGASPETEARLRFAAGQHEIIRVLLKEREYSKILPEFRKILELDLEGENERPVLKSTWFFVGHLRKANQYSLAHQLIDEALDHLQSRDSKFILLILKGKTFDDEGRTREALEIFRKAQQFEE